MIVCVCRRVSDGAVRASVAAGARTAHDVGSETGAGTACGHCRDAIRAIVEHARPPCSFPPCAGCPRTSALDAPRRDAA